MAAGYQEQPAKALKALLKGLLSRTTVGQLSDSITNRYGTDDISPATFAYWQESCSVYGGATAQSEGGPADQFLRTWHEPCGQIRARNLTLPLAGACVVVSDADAVVPSALTRSWGRLAKHVRGVRHGAIVRDVLRRCER